MKSKFIILLFCAGIVSVSAFCQMAPIIFKTNGLNKIKADSAAISNNFVAVSMLVTPNFYHRNLAFFCRQEIKFEKTTKIPFKFRLGSVQQVDYLEGKNTAKP